MQLFVILQDFTAWTANHVSIVKDLVEYQHQQYLQVGHLLSLVFFNHRTVTVKAGQMRGGEGRGGEGRGGEGRGGEGRGGEGRGGEGRGGEGRGGEGRGGEGRGGEGRGGEGRGGEGRGGEGRGGEGRGGEGRGGESFWCRHYHDLQKLHYVKVSSYIAQYPIFRIAQSALYFT